MSNWKADLDALVQETMAFTRSVRVQAPMPRTVVEPNRMPSVNLNTQSATRSESALRTSRRSSPLSLSETQSD